MVPLHSAWTPSADAMLVNKIVGLQTLRDSGISDIQAIPIQLPFFQKFSTPFAQSRNDFCGFFYRFDVNRRRST